MIEMLCIAGVIGFAVGYVTGHKKAEKDRKEGERLMEEYGFTWRPRDDSEE